MAILKNNKNGEAVFLHLHHVFGRRKTANGTWLHDAEISSIHAVVRWSGERWLIRDYSKNGSWLDGRRLQTAVELPLHQGARIGFGRPESDLYTVIDLAPPAPLLARLNGETEQVIELKPINALPNEQSPEIFVFLSDQGKWICEEEHRAYPLCDGDILYLDNTAWRFMAAGVCDATLDIARTDYTVLHDMQLLFHVSLDEEHTFLQVRYDEETFDLGERIHHFLLLTLARCRQVDRERRIDPAEQGWIEIDALSKMLGLEVSHTNIQIFRARKQVYEALPEKPSPIQLIERRRGAVRLGCSRFSIIRGSVHETRQLTA